MGTDDKTTLEKELHQSTAEVENAVAELPDDEARMEASGGWSILGCLEHVVLVDRGFSARIASATASPEPVVNAEREEMIRREVPLRKKRFMAPEQVHPTGKHHTVREALDELTASRERLVEMLEENDGKLRMLTVQHPGFGTMSVYEAFLLLAGHANRHANQIREMRKDIEAARPK